MVSQDLVIILSGDAACRLIDDKPLPEPMVTSFLFTITYTQEKDFNMLAATWLTFVQASVCLENIVIKICFVYRDPGWNMRM